MKTRIALSLLASAFVFAVAGEASAKGACVYVKNETFQCSDRVSSLGSCQKKAPGGLGEFHDGTNCKQIGHGVTWGIASPPAPPAKANFQGVSMSAPMDVPPIPSPIQKKKAAKSRRF
ncbi:MAG: hypothetical protein JRH10_16530 [Deltaproteobacteria bacterium]|nr:hypothetical protein [Deltaproteobacteria bacterium]MBW2448089.1 hypothetical protein [Deltaproteobacteria bacterium]